jgi:hypothetical protein
VEFREVIEEVRSWEEVNVSRVEASVVAMLLLEAMVLNGLQDANEEDRKEERMGKAVWNVERVNVIQHHLASTPAERENGREDRQVEVKASVQKWQGHPSYACLFRDNLYVMHILCRSLVYITRLNTRQTITTSFSTIMTDYIS